VILPFHKSDLLLTDAIASIKRSIGVQTNLILIDDRPEFEESNLVPTVRTGGAGYVSALNASLPHLQSEFCALMNSDDLVHPLRFVKQVSGLKESGKNISVTRLRKFKGSGFPVFMLGGNPRFKKFFKEAQLISSYYANASWLMRTDYWKSTDAIVDFGNGSDWALGVKLFEDCVPFVHHEAFYFYRSHKNQGTKNKEELNPELSKIWQQLNQSLGLPEFPGNIGVNLTLPGNKIHSDLDFDQVLLWTNEFKSRYPELEKLLALRLVALLHYTGEFNQLRRFPFIFKYLPTLSSMYAFNKITGT
jgi:glycosyltransferase involved in cell wall biosynthesis